LKYHILNIFSPGRCEEPIALLEAAVQATRGSNDRGGNKGSSSIADSNTSSSSSSSGSSYGSEDSSNGGLLLVTLALPYSPFVVSGGSILVSTEVLPDSKRLVPPTFPKEPETAGTQEQRQKYNQEDEEHIWENSVNWLVEEVFEPRGM
jgi:hypothetical protein